MKIIQMIKVLNRKHLIIGSASILVLFLVVTLLCVSGSSDEVVYKDTEVFYGNLTVGISESSSVDIGTVEQTFELDINSLISSDATSSTSSNSSQNMGAQGMGGQTDMFTQIFSLASSGTSEAVTSENSVEIKSVLVSVGQRIDEGDALFTLTEESVADIRTQLAEDVASAETDLEELKTDQTSSRLSANQTYDSSIAYGEYAKTEYELTVADLKTAVSDAQDSLNTAQAELTLLKKELANLNTEYANAKSALQAAEYGIQSVDKVNNTYWYVQYENTRDEAENTVESLEQSLEQKEQSIEQAESSLSQMESALSQAKRNLAKGLLTAKETYDLRILAYDNASETREVTLAYLDNNLASMEETYQEVYDKLSEIDDYIIDYTVLSEYSGVITDVSIQDGDSITKDSAIITLYDDEAITMSATITEDDMETIELGTEANIVLIAYSDVVLKGYVSEISDATYNSNTGENEYTVTATIQGDVSGLYQGMTGNITFITKETAEVIYVSNRAIFRDGTDSYVKVRDESGIIVQKTVLTGFSDGVNVEILEGLSEGDIVLIESKVSE